MASEMVGRLWEVAGEAEIRGWYDILVFSSLFFFCSRPLFYVITTVVGQDGGTQPTLMLINPGQGYEGFPGENNAAWRRR